MIVPLATFTPFLSSHLNLCLINILSPSTTRSTKGGKRGKVCLRPLEGWMKSMAIPLIKATYTTELKHASIQTMSEWENCTCMRIRNGYIQLLWSNTLVGSIFLSLGPALIMCNAPCTVAIASWMFWSPRNPICSCEIALDRIGFSLEEMVLAIVLYMQVHRELDLYWLKWVRLFSLGTVTMNVDLKAWKILLFILDSSMTSMTYFHKSSQNPLKNLTGNTSGSNLFSFCRSLTICVIFSCVLVCTFLCSYPCTHLEKTMAINILSWIVSLGGWVYIFCMYEGAELLMSSNVSQSSLLLLDFFKCNCMLSLVWFGLVLLLGSVPISSLPLTKLPCSSFSI